MQQVGHTEFRVEPQVETNQKGERKESGSEAARSRKLEPSPERKFRVETTVRISGTPQSDETENTNFRQPGDLPGGRPMTLRPGLAAGLPFSSRRAEMSPKSKAEQLMSH